MSAKTKQTVAKQIVMSDPAKWKPMFADLCRFMVKYTLYQPKQEDYSEQFWQNFVVEGNSILTRYRSTLCDDLMKAIMDECTRIKRQKGVNT